MQTLSRSGTTFIGGKNINTLVRVSDRKQQIAFCAIITFLLAALFGILNIIGSQKMKVQKIEFPTSSCTASICTVSSNLNFDSNSYVYLDYEFLLTSYFIYAKGTSFNDLFKQSKWRDDKTNCYPVATYREHYDVLTKLGLQDTNPLILEGLARNNGNDRISPCGLKAALYEYLGDLQISSGVSAVSINSKVIVPESTQTYIRSDSSDYVDVKDPRFIGWYSPVVPAWGTKLFKGQIQQDLKGEFTFKFDRSSLLPY